jgi:hypothetical protein
MTQEGITMTTIQSEVHNRTGSLARMARGWDRFWFRPADPTILGLIRLCAGFLVFYVHFAYSYDLQTFFGPNAWLDTQIMNEFRKEAPVIGPAMGWEDAPPLGAQNSEELEYMNKWGVNPRQTVTQGHHIWSIWFHVTDPVWMWVVHATVLTFMFSFAIGFCTRITAVLTWLAMLSYINRAQTSLFGMDAIMVVIVLYLMIGPSGSALSVDRLIARYRAIRRARKAHLPRPEAQPPVPSVSANLAIRLLQVHFCIIYLVAGLSKLQGPMWWNGTAVWATMVNFEFCPMRNRLYADALRFLAEHRWLWEMVTTGGTLFTLVFEISFPFLIWNPRLRRLVISAAVLLHLGIALVMGLVSFSIIMLTGVLSFVPSEAVRRFLNTLAWRPAPSAVAVAGA